MNDQSFVDGLQNGFEADRPKVVPAVYWLDGGRTICVRYSFGGLYSSGWQTPEQRESLRKNIAATTRQGKIDYDEAYELWAAACDLITDRLEVFEETPQRYDWQLTVLTVAGLAMIAAIVWMILDAWSW